MIENNCLWLHIYYDKVNYRNHKIKNHFLDRFRDFRYTFWYIKNDDEFKLCINKTYTKAVFWVVKLSDNLNNVFLESI